MHRQPPEVVGRLCEDRAAGRRRGSGPYTSREDSFENWKRPPPPGRPTPHKKGGQELLRASRPRSGEIEINRAIAARQQDYMPKVGIPQ
jgi:hypothetical protein